MHGCMDAFSGVCDVAADKHSHKPLSHPLQTCVLLTLLTLLSLLC